MGLSGDLYQLDGEFSWQNMAKYEEIRLVGQFNMFKGNYAENLGFWL